MLSAIYAEKTLRGRDRPHIIFYNFNMCAVELAIGDGDVITRVRLLHSVE